MCACDSAALKILGEKKEFITQLLRAAVFLQLGCSAWISYSVAYTIMILYTHYISIGTYKECSRTLIIRYIKL